MNDETKPTRHSGYIPVQTTEPSNTNTNIITIDTAKLDPGPEIAAKKTDSDSDSILDMVCAVIVTLTIMYTFCNMIVNKHETDHYCQHEFVLGSVSVSPINAWNITFNVTNLNIFSNFYYEKAKVSVFYEEQLLWTTTIPGFYQGVGDQTPVKATIDSSPAGVPTAIAWNRRLHLPLHFSVKVVGMVRRDSGQAWEMRYWVGVCCKNVKIEFPSPAMAGKLSGGSMKCEVETSDYVMN